MVDVSTVTSSEASQNESSSTRSINRKLRHVAFIHDTTMYGGMEVHMMLLMRYFDPTRYKVSVVVPGYNDENRSSPQRFIDEVRAMGAEVLKPPHPGEQKIISPIRDIYNLVQLFKKGRFDIVHIHTCRPEGARKATIAARLAGVPVLLRSEHLPPSVYGSAKSKYIVKPFDWLTDCNIATSEACLKDQISFLHRNPKKMPLSYYGIDMHRLNPNHNVSEAKQRLGFDPNLPLIGKVGRLVEQKGVTYMVEAAKLVVQEYGPVNFVVVGNGPLEATLRKQIAEASLTEYFHLVGYQPNTIPYIEAMDITTMASIFEALGLAMLENMAMAKPSVVTDLDCFKEIQLEGETGFIVASHSGKSLAEGYLKLLRNPELAKRMGQAALQQVTTKFSAEYSANEIMQIYDNLLAKKH